MGEESYTAKNKLHHSLLNSANSRLFFQFVVFINAYHMIKVPIHQHQVAG
jgi:hypothetical protein